MSWPKNLINRRYQNPFKKKLLNETFCELCLTPAGGGGIFFDGGFIRLSTMAFILSSCSQGCLRAWFTVYRLLVSTVSSFLIKSMAERTIVLLVTTLIDGNLYRDKEY